MSLNIYSNVQAADAFGYIGTDLATIRLVTLRKVNRRSKRTDTII
jgi:hypothetical protein